MSLLFHKKDTHGYKVPSKQATKFVQVLYEVARPEERGVSPSYTQCTFYFLIFYKT